MRIVLWIKGNRGVACMEKVMAAGFEAVTVVLQPQPNAQWRVAAERLAEQHSIPTLDASDPNDPELLSRLAKLDSDLFVLAGYGKILGQEAVGIPRRMCLNLHGGKLPEYRGSSPMNWALINGEKTFGLSVIRVDPGVDTGDVLAGRTFPIGPDDTIVDLHRQADKAFPEMLVEVLQQVREDSEQPQKQDEAKAGYYPLRFPDDGLILWDMLTAEQIHNRIRALTEPYPCAFTFFEERKVRLITSQLRDMDFHGEPGRIYLKKDRRLLVCARDKCLWLDEAVFEDSGQPLFDSVERYGTLATVGRTVMDIIQRVDQRCGS